MWLVLPGEVMHGQIVDVEPHFGHGVQIGHLRSAQKHDHLPIFHVQHLTWYKWPSAGNFILPGMNWWIPFSWIFQTSDSDPSSPTWETCIFDWVSSWFVTNSKMLLVRLSIYIRFELIFKCMHKKWQLIHGYYLKDYDSKELRKWRNDEIYYETVSMSYPVILIIES